jgi:hypothetical protein
MLQKYFNCFREIYNYKLYEPSFKHEGENNNNNNEYPTWYVLIKK